MVRGSKPQFSIGIYGKWGTGKTTLMKMVEKKLNTFVKKEVFTWDNITKDNSEDNRLKSFLKEHYRVDWIENSQFVKAPNSNTITINDENPREVVDSKGSYHNEYDHSLSIGFDDNKRTATLTIDNNLVREFDVKVENGKANIYLQENEILTIWFNAWRYEREDQFALIALLKTIAYAMGGLPQYREIKKILLRGAVIIGKGVLRGIVEKWIPLVPKESLGELEKNLLPKMELLSQVDKDTIYFDGLHKIDEEMKKTIANNSNNRIVVFIDDLDRCSPKTALEVFESIKVFLGMEGFIYIVGLSVDTISKLINVAYKDSLVKGEDYIRKIIQLPITIPEWNDPDVIEKLVENLSKLLDGKYSKLVDENKKIIAKAVELNPREVKRFINNFIISREIFSGDEVKPEELLLVQALKMRWNDFYSYISTDEKFRQEVKKYAELSEDDRIDAINKRKNDKDNPPKGYENKVFDFESKDLWDFLRNNMKVVFQIDWKVYRHVVESLKQEKEIIKESVAVSERGKIRTTP
jgi:KAP family P-loop domain